MLVDTDKLRAEIGSRIIECNRTLESGMFPQVEEDARDERREMRALHEALVKLENFWTLNVTTQETWAAPTPDDFFSECPEENQFCRE